MTDDALKFDVLVIGAGPAGLNAAQVAASAGARVGLVDDNALPGGQVWRQGPDRARAHVHKNAHASGHEDAPENRRENAHANAPENAYAETHGETREKAPEKPARGLRDALAALARHSSNVTYLDGTRIVQALAPRQLLAQDARRGFRLGYERLILATGARERFLPYPGWTLPGVTGAGGLQALVKGGLPVDGERIVVAGTGPLLWAVAASAHARGARVVAIVEQAAPARVGRFALGLVQTPAKLAQALRLRWALRAVPYWRGAHVVEAEGGARLTHVRVRRGESVARVACERLACAYGLAPNTRLGAALGCRVGEDARGAALAVDDWQATSVADVYAAGECAGVGGMELAAVEGRIAACAALGERAQARRLFAARAHQRRFAARMARAFALDPSLGRLAAPDTLLCRCEDVAFGDVARHASWRDAKLQTRCGMGACQGQICGEAAAFCFGWPRDAQRPPLAPTRIGTLLDAFDDDIDDARA